MRVKSALLPIYGFISARVPTRVGTVTPQPSKTTSHPGGIEKGAEVKVGHFLVVILSDEPLTIPKFTVIGVAEPVSKNLVKLVNSGE